MPENWLYGVLNITDPIVSVAWSETLDYARVVTSMGRLFTLRRERNGFEVMELTINKKGG